MAGAAAQAEIVAGGMSKSGIAGYVAAFPIPEVLTHHTDSTGTCRVCRASCPGSA
jgi:hypothetical protein